MHFLVIYMLTQIEWDDLVDGNARGQHMRRLGGIWQLLFFVAKAADKAKQPAYDDANGATGQSESDGPLTEL